MTHQLRLRPATDNSKTARFNNEPCSNPLSLTYTGRLDSLADIDFYQVTSASSVSATNPAVVEIDLTWSGATGVDPAFSLIYSDEQKACTTDACCAVLETSCDDALDCTGNSTDCINNPALFCADSTCSPAPTCSTDQSCAGVSRCLPSSKCAVRQFRRTKDNGQQLRTAQPLFHDGTFWIRVSDNQDADYDRTVTYTLKVRVCRDPDPNPSELDTPYFPRLITDPNGPPAVELIPGVLSKDVEDYFDDSTLMRPVVPKPAEDLPANPGTSVRASIQGYLSFEHDEDVWEIGNPCVGDTLCQLLFEFDTIGSCPPDLEFVYFVEKNEGAEGFPASPTSGQSGTNGYPAQCVPNPDGTDNLKVRVSDLYHNSWSWTCQYRLRVKSAAMGCPSPCFPGCGPNAGKCFVAADPNCS